MWDKLQPTCQPHVLSFVPDSLVHTDTEEKTHAITKEVLNIIRETGFKASREKAQLVQTQVKSLGLSLGIHGRTPEAPRVEVISKLPTSTNVPSLRALLGLFNFSSDFLESFADKAHPLYALLKKNVPWNWGPEQQAAFADLKQSLLQAPALARRAGPGGGACEDSSFGAPRHKKTL